MSSTDPPLTATAYAILGMVGLRPRTTHELSKAMQTSFDYFWPRARSGVYAEVKRLAGRGLLAAERDFVGRRPRTTYTITPAGQAALAAWLQTPPQTFALEVEGLLRVYLAGFGTRADLLQALERVRQEGATMRRIGAAFQQDYLTGTSPFMEQVHLRALLNDFLDHFAELVAAWAERSLATVRAWEDLSAAGKRAEALATIAQLLAHAAPPDGERSDK